MRNRVFVPLHLVGIALYVSLLLLPSPTRATSTQAQDDLPARVAVLEAQVAALTERVARLEAVLTAQQVTVQNGSSSTVYIGYTPSPITNSSTNLYSGPSTNYRIAGFVGQGQPLDIVGCNDACDWYALTGGYWIAAPLVDNPPSDPRRIGAPDQPVQNVFPTIVAATATPESSNASANSNPAATPVPVCACSSDLYNCSHFDTQPAAQACFAYCNATGAGDIHGLDGNDNDGLACESLSEG